MAITEKSSLGYSNAEIILHAKCGPSAGRSRPQA